MAKTYILTPDDVVNNLTSELEDVPLSAAQGKVLKGSVDAIPSVQSIFNLVHPIGETYIQYDTDGNPNTLFNGNGITSTWTDVSSSFDGRFFKADKTQNVGTSQDEQVPNIRGGLGMVRGSHGDFTKGAFIGGNVWGDGDVKPKYTVALNSLESSTTGDYYFVFNAASSNSKYVTNGVVRPLTSTVKIWKRTA